MTQKCDDINKFWQKFQKAVIDSGVSGAMAIWQIKWAKKFAFHSLIASGQPCAGLQKSAHFVPAAFRISNQSFMARPVPKRQGRSFSGLMSFISSSSLPMTISPSAFT